VFHVRQDFLIRVVSPLIVPEKQLRMHRRPGLAALHLQASGATSLPSR
jgi:hypothetical protein